MQRKQNQKVANSRAIIKNATQVQTVQIKCCEPLQSQFGASVLRQMWQHPLLTLFNNDLSQL